MDSIEEFADWLGDVDVDASFFDTAGYLSMFSGISDEDEVITKAVLETTAAASQTQFWNATEERFARAYVRTVDGTRRQLTNRARRIARERAGFLIAELQAEKKATVRRLINRAMKNNWSRKQLAGRIAAHVGLTARQRNAVENYRLTLIRQGKTPKEARRLFHKRIRAERAKRARFIAENEIFAVRAQAKRERWGEKVDEKKLSPKWKREWVTAEDERTCVICNPMNGSTANIGGVFTLKSGQVVPGPPVHPRCRCIEKLVLLKKES